MSKRRIPLTPETINILRAKPTMRISDATGIYNIGRNRIYDSMKSGQLKYTKLGGSTLLHTVSLEALVRQQYSL